MAKNLTAFVIILLVVLAIGWLLNLAALVILVVAASPFYSSVIQIVLLIIWALYWFKLLKVKPDVITWTHIAFGSTIGVQIVQTTIAMMTLAAEPTTEAMAATVGMGPSILIILMWIGTTMHLMRAKRDNLMEFS